MPSDPPDRFGKTQATNDGGRERRLDPRYPLTAEAQVTDVRSGSRFKVRVTDLSISGCYLDFVNPIPEHSDIIVQISRDKGVFETPARVAYNHPGMGLGIRFVDTKPTQQAILARWIVEFAAIVEG